MGKMERMKIMEIEAHKKIKFNTINLIDSLAIRAIVSAYYK